MSQTFQRVSKLQNLWKEWMFILCYLKYRQYQSDDQGAQCNKVQATNHIVEYSS